MRCNLESNKKIAQLQDIILIVIFTVLHIN